MPKHIFRSNIQVGERGRLTIPEIRNLALADPTAFMQRAQAAIDEGALKWSTIRDLKGLFGALWGVEVRVHIEELAGMQRAVTTAAFPVLASNLTIAGLQEAYEGIPTIADQLLTERDDPNAESNFVSVFVFATDQQQVLEGDDFPEIGAAEERVVIGERRNGFRLSITADMIERNEIGNIVDRINRLGEIANEDIEEQSLYRVYDFHGSKASGTPPYAYRPNGAGTALYSATANTPGTRAPSGTRVQNNALADTSDLDNVLTVLRAMKNERGKRINIPLSRCQLLIPSALEGKAATILSSRYLPGSANNDTNPWGPEGTFKIGGVVSSAKLDDMSTSRWAMGDFKRQFIRKWALRQETVTMGQETESFLRSRIAFQARIAYNCEVGARDYVWTVESLSGTTAPGDE